MESPKVCAVLVMIKVELKFCLDQTYKGPYRMLNVTSTNAVIHQVKDSYTEKLNVSLQRLSKCDGCSISVCVYVILECTCVVVFYLIGAHLIVVLLLINMLIGVGQCALGIFEQCTPPWCNHHLPCI